MTGDLLPIATITKSAREEFRVALRHRTGAPGIDLRVYASNGIAMVSTPKGVVIPPSILRAVIEALEEAERLVGAPASRLAEVCR